MTCLWTQAKSHTQTHHFASKLITFLLLSQFAAARIKAVSNVIRREDGEAQWRSFERMLISLMYGVLSTCTCTISSYFHYEISSGNGIVATTYSISCTGDKYGTLCEKLVALFFSDVQACMTPGWILIHFSNGLTLCFASKCLVLPIICIWDKLSFVAELVVFKSLNNK